MPILLFSLLIAVLLPTASALEVNITSDLSSVDIDYQGETVTIQRNQDSKNKIVDTYALTSRPCPPFCVQPMQIGQGVETVGELEVLNYIDKMQWGEAVNIVDSRTPKWFLQGTIPGATNIPWTQFSIEQGSNSLTIHSLLTEQLGAKFEDELWDFSAAKTLVLFCNGVWCGQSPASIRTLLKLGYPAHKIKWYRGGMQAWHALGLTTVKPKK